MSMDKFDAEHLMEPATPFFGEVVKIRVGVKSLSLTTKKGNSFTFQKGAGSQNPRLSLRVEWPETKTERCSLGHDHVVKKEYKHYEWGSLPWELVDQLISWLEQGEWKSTPRKPAHSSFCDVDPKTLKWSRSVKAGEITKICTDCRIRIIENESRSKPK